MQQPPLDDTVEGVASVGIAGEIGENVITSYSLYSGQNRFSYFLALLLCIYRAIKIIAGFAVLQFSNRAFLPTEAAVSKTTACISSTYYQGKLNLIESNDCPVRCHERT
jgi:hypothetical protein